MIIFAADLFVKEYVGGAELTLEALIEKCPFSYERVLTSRLNKNFVDNNKDKFWIFGNTAGMSPDLLLYVAKHINYAAIECDYKFCKYRLPELHYEIEKEVCNCDETKRGKTYALFYYHAKLLWWMSKAQQNIWIDKFPFLTKTNNFVLSSVFDEKTLDIFDNFSVVRKNNKVGVVASESWVKGAENSFDFVKKNNIEYEPICNLPYKQVLEKLSKLKGLVLMPNGGDTCPRIAIEAKLLGCELHINENVQHQHENWFTDKATILSYLKKQKKIFWKETQNTISKNISEFFSKNKYSFGCPSYNEGYRLERFLRSCLKLRGLSEVHIVNHRSDDETEDIIKKMKPLFKKEKKILFSTYEGRDFSRDFTMADLRNIAVQKCTNDIVYSVDADWIFGPNFELLMYQAFHQLSQKDVYAVGHKMYSVDEFIKLCNGEIKDHGDCFKHVPIPRLVLRKHTICQQTGTKGKYFQFVPSNSERTRWKEISYMNSAILAINDKSQERKNLRATMNKFFELSLNNKNYESQSWIESYKEGNLKSDVTSQDYFHPSNRLSLSFVGEEYFA